MITVRISNSGTIWWFLNNNVHRVNGPAITSQSGIRYWLLNNNVHRVNGPAVIDQHGDVEYWINGHQLTDYEIMFMMQCVNN